ncbi:MAG: hypothetical protein ACYTFA_17910, partial [Planctomycetota bacterium]
IEQTAKLKHKLAKQMEVLGHFTKQAGGMYASNSSKVRFTGALQQMISGAPEFHDVEVEKQTADDELYKLESAAGVTVAGHLRVMEGLYEPDDVQVMDVTIEDFAKLYQKPSSKMTINETFTKEEHGGFRQLESDAYLNFDQTEPQLQLTMLISGLLQQMYETRVTITRDIMLGSSTPSGDEEPVRLLMKQLPTASGAGESLINVCDMGVHLDELDVGDEMFVQCGSLVADVVEGPVELFPDEQKDLMATVPDATKTTITDLGDDVFEIENDGESQGAVVVTIGDSEFQIPPGGMASSDSCGTLHVQVNLHTAGAGGSTIVGIEGLELRVFDKTQGSCARDYGISHRHYSEIFNNCVPVAYGVTDADGSAGILLEAGDYVLIGEYDPDGYPPDYDGDEGYIGVSASDFECAPDGDPNTVTMQKHLQVIILPNGRTVGVYPRGGRGRSAESEFVEITNVAGADHSVTFIVSDEGLHANAISYTTTGRVIVVDSWLSAGELFMTVLIPFDSDDVGSSDPLSMDLVHYGLDRHDWELAVAGNAQPSPGHEPNVVGDRFEIVDTTTPTLSGDLGDSGVFWNPADEEGFVWANVDHASEFAAGVAAAAPVASPAAATGQHAARKNRYISFAPNNPGNSVAFQVEMTASYEFPTSTGVLGWVGQADENDVSRVVSDAHFSDAWPQLVHVGDCRIVPVATFGIRATQDGVLFSESLEVSTIHKPGARFYGDTVGVGTGDMPPLPGFTPPNRIVNVNDLQAYLLTVQGPASPSAHTTWLDLHGLGEGSPPNYVLNVSDLQRILFGLEGQQYIDAPEHLNPVDCP